MEKRRLPIGYIAVGVVALVLIAWLTQRYMVKRQLLRSLGTNDMPVRIAAVEKLMEMEKLEDSLPAQPIINRSKTAQALGEIGTGDAIGVLGTILEDQELKPREWAMRALVKQGESAIPTLIAGLSGGGSDEAIEGLTRLAKAGFDPSSRLRFYLSDRSVYGAAAQAMAAADVAAAEVGAESRGVGIESLVRACYTNDSNLRAQGLGKLGGQALAVGVEPALHNLQPDWSQGDAIKALGSIGDPRAVVPIIPFLKDKDNREAAVTALGQIGDVHAVDPILATMTETEKRYRDAAILALSRIGPNAFPSLVRDLRSPEVLRRRAAAAALIGSASPEVSAPLVAALQDEDREVRVSAALALGWEGNVAAVAPLVNALSDPEWQVVDAGVEALGSVGLSALDSLLTVLADPARDRTVRYQVARAMALMGRPAVAGLIAALDSPQTEVQTWTVVALGDIGDQRAAEALRELKPHASPDVRWVIEEQLGRLSRLEGS